MSRVIEWDEVKKHNTLKDLWIVVHGHVYDVSAWQKDHPGGYEILLEKAKEGVDAGKYFEEILHSNEARDIATQFLIGKVPGAPATFPRSNITAQGGNTGKLTGKKTSTSGKSSSGQDDDNTMMIVGAAVVALVVGGILYMQSKKKA